MTRSYVVYGDALNTASTLLRVQRVAGYGSGEAAIRGTFKVQREQRQSFELACDLAGEPAGRSRSRVAPSRVGI